MTLEDRTEEFRKHVYHVGGTVYTPEMLRRFVEHWSEPDRAKKPKMRWEKQKTWSTERRLARWARNNYDGIPCFLTESQKTIAQKKRDFAISLEPFLEKYGREMLNSFYLYWTQVENKREPEYIRWELEDFWSLETRLAQWKERNPTEHKPF